jgi:hypothetical protein
MTDAILSSLCVLALHLDNLGHPGLFDVLETGTGLFYGPFLELPMKTAR